MVDPKAGKFINSLVKSLQMLCHGYMDFKDNIEIIGHIYLRIDNSQKFDYIVNEQVSKQGDDSTFFQSNSYHSLPPSKTGRERERSASSRSEEDTVAANHHRLEDSALTGSRVQIDLSGPVPVTRNSESSPECFFSAATIASEIRRRSHSRDSQPLAHPMEEDHHRALAAVGVQDHSHNHSSLSGARDHEQAERPASSSADRPDANSLYGVKDMDKSRQQETEEMRGQDASVIVKAEPGDQNTQMMGIPSVSSMLPMAHQSAMLSNAAHTGHAMFAATTMGHHGMFDTSLATTDMAESHHSHRDTSYRPVRGLSAGEDNFQHPEAGEDLSKQNSQNRNGVAMSLVTRNRVSPDLNYPQGPMQLPQTADTGKDITPAPSQNRCDYCAKHFRTAELLQMHIALIHSHRGISNYLSPKSLRTSQQLSTFLSSPTLSPSSRTQRRTSQSPGHQSMSQSPGHQSTSSSSSRSKSQSPISLLPQTQPLALTQQHSMAASLPASSASPNTSLAMALSNSAAPTPQSAAAAAAAATAAALAQSFSVDKSGMEQLYSVDKSMEQLMETKGPLQASPYQCHLCHMPFVNWAVLAQHQASCPRRGPHKCDQCGKAFRSKTSLTDHINTIHRRILFVCKGCRETFKWRTHIYQHKRKCPALQNANFESGSFIEERQAPPLPVSADSQPVTQHEEMEEETRPPPVASSADYGAELARQSYVQEALMQQIINAQKQAQQHLPHAGKDVKPFTVSTDHGTRHTDSFLQPFPAHVKNPSKADHSSLSPPPRSSSTLTSTKTSSHLHHRHRSRKAQDKTSVYAGRPHHTREMLRGKKRVFTCSHCQYVSVRRYNLERHIRLRHPSYRFLCPLENCRMILLDEVELRTHLQAHSDTTFPRCSHCGVPCNNYDDLAQHRQVCDASQGSLQTPGGGEEKDSGDTETGDKGEGGENRDDNDDEVEMTDDGENLPVHFLKEKMESPELSTSQTDDGADT